jgi:hypothetical protein
MNWNSKAIVDQLMTLCNSTAAILIIFHLYDSHHAAETASQEGNGQVDLTLTGRQGQGEHGQDQREG